MRRFALYLLLVFYCTGYSQDSPKEKGDKMQYIKIQDLRKSGRVFTAKDSLNFKFVQGDTLVLLDETFPEFFQEEGVKVPYEPRDKKFLEVYRQVVFDTEKVPEGKGTIKIWKNGIRLFFDSSVPNKHKREFLNFTRKISEGIDSLQISEVKSRAQSNYLIFYKNSEDDFDQEPKITAENGDYYVNWDSRQRFTRGVIKINAYKLENKSFQLDLLKYHFFKSLGHFKSSKELPCKSFLSACRVVRELSPEDLELLKYHYSFGICKGIDLERFDNIHEDFQATLEKHPDAQLFVVHYN